MLFDLTKEQALYAKRKLPKGYSMMRKGKQPKVEKDFEALGHANPDQVLEDQIKCARILSELKKSEAYKALTAKDSPNFLSGFVRKFGQVEETFKTELNEQLKQQNVVIGKFYDEMHKLFYRVKVVSSKEQIKLLEAVEQHLEKLFTPYQKYCLMDLNKMVRLSMEKPLKKPEKIKQKPVPTDLQKQEVWEKLERIKRLYSHYLKTVLDMLGSQKREGIYEVNLNSLSIPVFWKLSEFTKSKVHWKSIVKQSQKFQREYQQTYFEENSYNSCLSDSAE